MNRDCDATRAGMFDGIAQRFARDLVGLVTDDGAQVPRRAVDRHVNQRRRTG
jgi:hypothetical protein